jgi:ribosomal protein S16
MWSHDVTATQGGTMSKRNAKYQKKIADACQPHVGEPIKVVGLFQPHGTLGAFAMGYFVNPFAAASMQRGANARAEGMPQIGLYALTETNLHVCEGIPRGTGWKVKEYIGYWPRSSFTARPVEGRLTDQVVLDFGEGDAIRLESIRMMSGGFNQDIIQELVTART